MVMGEFTQETDVVVIGGGPGGYAAAFRAADLGLEVTLVEADARLGGVCLQRGCIPSKTLLHVSQLLYDARHAGTLGLHFGEPVIELEKIRSFKDGVIEKLTGGLALLAQKRSVQVLHARAEFEDATHLRLHGGEISRLKFKHAIIATGSRPIIPSGILVTENGRVMDSTGALALPDAPESLLVIGGGYVGLELGSVYATLGSRVTVVEMGERLIAAADADLAKPLLQRINETFEAVYTGTKVVQAQEDADGVTIHFEGPRAPATQRFDRVLVAVGRRPNSEKLGLPQAGVQVDARGFIQVDAEQRTNTPHIFAIGDVAGGLMLAHKAMREGKVAAEVIAGQPAAFDARAIPAVVYTDPQLAWAGLTENEARAQQRPVKVLRFPWSASGRALTMDAAAGLTKMLVEPESGAVLGVGIVGREAGEMIAEGVLAIEMGALAEDLALTIHAHPTLTETEGEVAELFLGSATHILPRR